MSQPYLSIITINLNNGDGLSQTLASVWEQQNVDSQFFEHIVVDGKSSDSSVEVIDRYRSRLSHIVCEQDRGIYNAMNKGILLAQGRYLLFLNSGDYLFDHVLSKAIFEKGDEDIVYCNSMCFSASKRWPVRHPERLDLPFFITDSLLHPSTFIKRQLFDKELYNENFKIVSDWEFFVKKIILDKCSTRYEPVFISYIDTTGISSTSPDLSWGERKAVLIDIAREHGGLFIDTYLQQHKVLTYIFKAHLPEVLKSMSLQKKLRRWVKPLLWFTSK